MSRNNEEKTLVDTTGTETPTTTTNQQLFPRKEPSMFITGFAVLAEAIKGQVKERPVLFAASVPFYAVAAVLLAHVVIPVIAIAAIGVAIAAAVIFEKQIQNFFKAGANKISNFFSTSYNKEAGKELEKRQDVDATLEVGPSSSKG